MAFILLSVVGDAGDVLPDRGDEDCELSEEWDPERLRFSSAKTSSRETLRCGWVMGTSSRFSTNLEAIVE